MKKQKKLVLFGTGEIATLARFYFTEDSPYEVSAFTADDEFVKETTFAGLPLVPFSRVRDAYPPSEFEMHVALSYRKLNQIRAEKYRLAKTAGYRLASYVCSKSVTWSDLSHGDNCFVLENQTIQPTVKIGNNVMLWSGNHIGHASIIRDDVYISSHVVLCGHTDIGSRCFLGVNSTIRDFAKIGDDCFIAMDASVTSPEVPAGSVVIGARGDVFPPDSPVARKLRAKYFGL